MNYTTGYRYDGLGNLTQVAQGSQVRTFVYSSLSRLLSASNPESGTTRYVYDDAGNLITRTDARSVTATYTYDDLHRPKTIAYSDTTPGVTYAYHTSAGASGTANVGRLQSIRTMTAPSDYVATSTYAYDTLGRVKTLSQTIAGHPDTFTFTNTYFLNSAPKSQTYP